MNILYEEVIAETRDQQLDLLARAKFAAHEQVIYETRATIEELIYPYEDSGTSLDSMMALDWIEVM